MILFSLSIEEKKKKKLILSSRFVERWFVDHIDTIDEIKKKTFAYSNDVLTYLDNRLLSEYLIRLIDHHSSNDYCLKKNKKKRSIDQLNKTPSSITDNFKYDVTNNLLSISIDQKFVRHIYTRSIYPSMSTKKIIVLLFSFFYDKTKHMVIKQNDWFLMHLNQQDARLLMDRE